MMTLSFSLRGFEGDMAQSLSNVLIHTVFSTKDRCPHIIPALQPGGCLENASIFQTPPEMHAYLAKICQSLGCFVFKIGGVEDHVHLFTTLPRTLTQSSFIEEIKISSSKWIKGKHPDLKIFSWQRGFGIFSICPTHIDALIHDIATQAEHHKDVDFKTEFRNLLKKNNLSFNEEYLWD
jgi:REP element-mobilizing transposase RayT